MCYYRLYIFLGCGHTTFSARPVRPCAAVRSKRASASQHQQHAATPQDASPKTPPQTPEPPTTTTPAEAHATDAATFHPHHDSTPNASPRPHTEDATQPQQPMTFRPGPEADADADADADAAPSEECAALSTHPFQTLSIHTLCALCLRRRAVLLRQLEQESSTVRFEDWRWKVKYLSPTPEEARYSAEWGNVGSAMGSWVKDWRVKGDGILGAFRDQGVDEERRRDSATGGLGSGIAGMLSPGRRKGKAKGSVRSLDSERAGNKGRVVSS